MIRSYTETETVLINNSTIIINTSFIIGYKS